MNILERYIGKTILLYIFVVLLVIMGLAGIIKYVEEFRHVGKGSYDALSAAYYTVLMLPSDLENFFPVGALIGSLLGLGALASNSELVVMQSAGFSRFKIGFAVMKTAIPLMILSMVIGEWIAPQTEQFARNMRAVAQSGGSMLATQAGFWAKDGSDFIYIRRITDEQNLNDILIYHFEERELKSILSAEKATFQSGNEWQLQNVQQAVINDEKIAQSQLADQPWKTSITPSKLGIVSLKPESLSISGLADYVGFLKDTGQDAKRFEITFWRKLYEPLAMAVMMLLAISFIFGPLRSSAMGLKIVIGVIAGFSFYVANIVFGNLTLVVSWLPVAISALIPSIVCILIVWWLLSKKRD
ncbi:Lipopolysaccharide export system permease protein lptG [Bibersteinia trehalosi USDA-ARS-USMARC-189]|uniref:Lipopolysaccharide export system permease protein lptG n=1 Tax=Bibersteinia trehalosi USDA-ARS-USMARC-189 TaxID=1263831 RepID=A0ABM5PC32_BIBTR|nr:LPS export ABC transporter permease LptG [Bibersteinia trehalosi]AGH38874.1 Lipopolysaccharide export system permease protein lptG [Bibersteinia trehalosi USDA-ARS-USMARC-192]AHG83591.1 Lipopolysaccharide export system permease protein lptG [Bibersteinia trehalosi USDA-ARS-USMARC-189]